MNLLFALREQRCLVALVQLSDVTAVVPPHLILESEALSETIAAAQMKIRILHLNQDKPVGEVQINNQLVKRIFEAQLPVIATYRDRRRVPTGRLNDGRILPHFVCHHRGLPYRPEDCGRNGG